MNLATVLALGVAMGVGSFIQTTIGFGMAVVAAPFLILFTPDLMPTALLTTSVFLPIVQLVHSRRDIAWRLLSWSLVGRLLTTPAGVWVVAAFSARAIAATVGALILLVVAVSVVTVRVRPSSSTSFGAGVLAGVSGTAAAIGGPYLALVLQHERPDRIRSTLAGFFVAGSVIALAGLALGGQVRTDQVLAGLLWLPFVGIGYVAALPARSFLDAGRLRTAVLWFCGIAGLSVLVRSLLG